MTAFKKFAAALCVLFVVTLFFACSKKAPGGDERTLIQVRDYAERIVAIEKPAKRLVVMADNALVVVKQLQAVETVVALDSKTKGFLPLSILKDINPTLLDIPDVGKTKSPNYEQIIELNPDLILLKGNKESADMMQEKTNVPVACVISKDGYDFDLYLIVGKLLGKEKEAAGLVNLFETHKMNIEKIVSSIEESKKKSAYIVVQNSKNNFFKTQKGSLSLELAGLKNVAANANKVDQWGFAELSKEAFIDYNPSLIFLDKPYSESGIHKDDLMADPTFLFSDAVKKQRIFYTHSFALPKDYVYVIAEAYYYANTAYPNIVTEDVYKNAINEIFKAAYGIDNYYETWKKSLL